MAKDEKGKNDVFDNFHTPNEEDMKEWKEVAERCAELDRKTFSGELNKENMEEFKKEVDEFNRLGMELTAKLFGLSVEEFEKMDFPEASEDEEEEE